jgi:hypothetical protein
MVKGKNGLEQENGSKTEYKNMLQQPHFLHIYHVESIVAVSQSRDTISLNKQSHNIRLA